jgi:hypothetical protein
MYWSLTYPAGQLRLQLPSTFCLLSALQSGGLLGVELSCERITAADTIWCPDAEEAIGAKLLIGDAGTEMTDAPDMKL